MIPAALRRAIWERADRRREYCLVHDDDGLLPHEPDHIVARQHHGPTRSENLALACFECNRFKGTNLSSVDPESGEVTLLFHPRNDRWEEHFRLEGAKIVPLTGKGRATARLLQLNSDARLADRDSLILQRRYPTRE